MPFLGDSRSDEARPRFVVSRPPWRRGIFALSGLVAFALACNGNTSNGDPEPGNVTASDAPASARLGEAGGTLAADGVSLTVPEGALDGAVELRVASLGAAAAAALPEARWPGTGELLTRVSSAYEVTPHGTTFARPVTLRFEVPGEAQVVLRLDDREDPTWEWVESASIEGSAASVQTDRFSVYAAFSLPGSTSEPGPRSPCDLYCEAGGILSCNEESAACWAPVAAGLALPESLGRSPTTYLTQGYSVDLANPGAPNYVAFVSRDDSAAFLGQPPAEARLAFFPLKQDLSASDLVVTQPFSLVTPPGGAANLIVRGIFPVSGVPASGYVVVGLADPFSYAGRPVVLLVSPATPEWSVREIRLDFSDPGPFEWTRWSDYRVDGFGVFGVRRGDDLDLVLVLNEPGSSDPPSHNRITLPLDAIQDTDGSLSVQTTQSNDAFPLSNTDPDASLQLMSIALSHDGRLATFSHGWRVVDDEAEFVQYLHAFDMGPASIVAQQRLDGLSNPASGATFGQVNCGPTVVTGTSGGTLAIVNADHLQMSQTGGIDTASVFYGDAAAFAYATTTSPRASLTRSACTTPVLDDPRLGSLLSVASPSAHHRFTSLWTAGSELSTGGFATVRSDDIRTDQLSVKWAGSSAQGPHLAILSSISSGAGWTLFALGEASVGTGRAVYHLALDEHGDFAEPLPLDTP